MQPYPVDSTKMIADHRSDEQDQYESDKYKDCLPQFDKNLELLGKEEQLDDLHDHLEWQRKLKMCKLQLHQEYKEIEEHESETEEAYNRLVMKMLEVVGKEQGFEILPQEEIELLDNPGGEGSAGPRSNHAPTITSSTKANRFIPLFGAMPESWIRTSRKRSYVGPFITSTNKKTWNPRHGEKGFVLNSADVKGNRVRKNISVISRAGSGGSRSERTSSTLTGDNYHHSYNDKPVVILDNQSQVHCTGIFSVLSNLTTGPDNIVLVAANGGIMETFISGSVFLENFTLPNVHYCPDLGNRIIVSGSMLDDDDYGYEFGRGKFTVKDLKNDTTVGKGHKVDGNYILDFLMIARERTRGPEQPGLLSTLWNICSALQRLGLK